MIEYNVSNKLIMQATQREALARTDARSDHAVLDFFFGYFHLHQGKRK